MVRRMSALRAVDVLAWIFRSRLLISLWVMLRVRGRGLAGERPRDIRVSRRRCGGKIRWRGNLGDWSQCHASLTSQPKKPHIIAPGRFELSHKSVVDDKNLILPRSTCAPRPVVHFQVKNICCCVSQIWHTIAENFSSVSPNKTNRELEVSKPKFARTHSLPPHLYDLMTVPVSSQVQ